MLFVLLPARAGVAGASALALINLAPPIAALAQPMPMQPQPSQSASKVPAPAAPGGAMDMPDMAITPTPMMAGALGPYSMTQDGSGTSWRPAASPMEGLTWASGGWAGMVHGWADLVYDQQNGLRGSNETFSESMVMVAAQHPEGPGVLTLRSMLSLDPAMGPAGYPLLLQTGETANGATPLVDRQHPHNLFMEAAALYAMPAGAGASVFLYLADPGEPALGPETFMHRLSGMDNPAAPITHHWLDSTHITFGVITTGLERGPWKVEASSFNGREPDQYRWRYDDLRLDSYSGRITFNPTQNWSFQVSSGFLHSPEQLTPNVDQHRTTASGVYDLPLQNGNWQTTVAWGRDSDRPGRTTDAYLLETTADIGPHALFARAETVAKDDLFYGSSPLANAAFHVSEATLGYLYDIPISQHVALGLGLQATVNLVPMRLASVYGSRTPLGSMPFLRLKLR